MRRTPVGRREENPRAAPVIRKRSASFNSSTRAWNFLAGPGTGASSLRLPDGTCLEQAATSRADRCPLPEARRECRGRPPQFGHARRPCPTGCPQYLQACRSAAPGGPPRPGASTLARPAARPAGQPGPKRNPLVQPNGAADDLGPKAVASLQGLQRSTLVDLRELGNAVPCAPTHGSSTATALVPSVALPAPARSVGDLLAVGRLDLCRDLGKLPQPGAPGTPGRGASTTWDDFSRDAPPPGQKPRIGSQSAAPPPP